jgi:hypothetical protein
MTTPQYDPSSGQYDIGQGQPGQTPGQYGQAPSGYGQAPGGAGPGFAMPKAPIQPQTNNSLASVVRKRGLRQVTIGAVIFVIGLAITVGTYHSASTSSSGGTYFVAYGPMIVGLIAVVRGLVAMARASKLN